MAVGALNRSMSIRACASIAGAPSRFPALTWQRKGSLVVQVCGEGEGILGDCVVPKDWALLEGAEQIVLPGVFHSMSKVR